MGSELIPPGDVKKPEESKVSALTETSEDEPIELEPDKQIEIYSDMGRTRTGIPRQQIWGDRTFSPEDVAHANAKPQDRGANPAVSEAQRGFMGAELGRLRRGERTETGMSESQLRDFAKKSHKKRKRHNTY